MTRRLILASGAFALMVLASAPPLDAAKIKVWQQNSQSQFEKAQFKNAVISSEGTLRLSRKVKPLAGIDAMHVWDVIEDRAGNLVVATGTEGKIFKVAADGKVELLYTAAESQVLCLTHGPDGAIFAGTGPKGTVIRITADRTAVFAAGLDSYVWSLAYDPAAKLLYAGTGPRGRVFQVNAEGKASVFCKTKQEHILRLALGNKGVLYAGTDKGGMVYRIEPSGKGFVIFHVPQSEILSLLVTADAVYAGTGSPVSHRGSGNSKTSVRMDEEFHPGTLSPGHLVTLPDAAPAPSQPATGENSLFRIAGDGTVRELFRDKVLILSLLKLDGHMLLGTGQHGQLFEVNEASKEKTEIARLDHGQIHCLLKRKDGSIVLGTGDPGKLYTLEDRFVDKGTVVSEVLDAKIISKWGDFNWRATVRPSTTVSVAVRSGNVPDPDETWSDWSAEQTDAQSSKALAPLARYLQYRVTLTSDNPRVSPEVHGLTFRYRTTNQAPEITSFDVPDIDAGNLDNPQKFKLKWSAVDPNEDELTFDLYFKKDGWKDWVKLESNLEKKDYDWDTTAVPSGIYQLKLVASDRKDNTAEEALTAERISAAFPVAHDPPRVTVKLARIENNQAVIEAAATDPLVRLTEASFALNGKRWTNVFPTDGLFDGKSKSFRFKTDTLRPGTHVLLLRVRDASGNVGTGDVVFTVPPKS